MARQRKKSNDSNIAKSFENVNKIFSSESAEQRAQREGEAKVRRAAQLKEQARDVLTHNSGGKTG